MKHILIPTDFSDCAHYAFEVAAQISRKSGGTLHLVHVYERPVYDVHNPGIDIMENSKLRKHIDEEMEKLKEAEFAKDLKIKTHVIPDRTLTELLESDGYKDLDLIVMGSHGASGWKELLIGSNTEKVVRTANCPVITVKKRHENFTLNDIVFASTFYTEVESVFPKIKRIAELFEATIHLVKVVTRTHFETTLLSYKLMNDFAEKFELKDYSVNTFNDDDLEDGIIHFSEHINADMIALTTHGRTGFSHIINGSLAEDVVNHVNRPVLSVKIKEKKVNYGVIFPD